MSQKQANSLPVFLNPEKTIVADDGWRGPAVLRLWHLSSLDAPTVAVVWSLGFAWAIGVRLPAWAPLLLALVAWAIYIVDRLLDARAGLRTPPLHRLRDRHHFHWRHRHSLGVMAAASVLATAWMVYELIPAGARVPDSALAAATFAYFSGIHSRRKLPPPMARLLSPFVTREFLVGVLFTAGCLLPMWPKAASGGAAIFRPLALPALYFTALAWLNCHAIRSWEANEGVPHRVGISTRMVRTAAVVGGTGLVLAAYQDPAYPRIAALLIAGAGSAFLLAVLERLRLRLSSLALRAMADLVLLTPVFCLVLGLPGK